MRKITAGGTILTLGYAGEHKNTQITFDLPDDWTNATSENTYLVFVAPGSNIGLPYDVEINEEEG